MEKLTQLLNSAFGSNATIIFGGIVAALALIIIIIILVSMSGKVKRAEQEALEQKRIYLQCIGAIVNTIDSNDPFSKEHSIRVAEYTLEIARRMKLDNLDNIYLIALLHDVGKIGIPDDILKRVGYLLPEEYALMKQHTEFGRLILNDVDSLPGIVEGAKYHHEHYNGSGYNEGLIGEAIPLIGRIICVADSYDAMTSPRTYRRGLSKAEAMNELGRCSGSQFDPAIARIMIDMLKEGFTVD